MLSGFPYSDNLLSTMRLAGDPAADAFVQKCFANEQSKKALYDWLNTPLQNADLDNVPEVFAEEAVFQNARKLPGWANEKLQQKGRAFFFHHQSQIMQLLGLLSLPYCYAAADGAMVLYLSERLRKDTSKRLADTGDFVLNVQQPGAFSEKGKGFAGILKTRLSHAIGRYYTLKSGKWNESWGFPVNQEDMAGTSLAFSLIVIRGLRTTGSTISYEDQEAFLHLWAVISFLLGVDVRLIPSNGKAANQLEKLIRSRQFRPSEQGRELAKSLVDSFTQIDPHAKVTVKEIKQLMAYLLGAEVCEMLGIDASPGFQSGYLIKIFLSLSSWNPYFLPKKVV